MCFQCTKDSKVDHSNDTYIPHHNEEIKEDDVN